MDAIDTWLVIVIDSGRMEAVVCPSLSLSLSLQGELKSKYLYAKEGKPEKEVPSERLIRKTGQEMALVITLISFY